MSRYAIALTLVVSTGCNKATSPDLGASWTEHRLSCATAGSVDRVKDAQALNARMKELQINGWAEPAEQDQLSVKVATGADPGDVKNLLQRRQLTLAAVATD